MITTTHFAHPTTGQTATVVVYLSLGVVVTKAYLGEAATPRWEERIALKGDTAVAVQSAHCWAGLYGRWLQRKYHLKRIAEARGGANHEQR